MSTIREQIIAQIATQVATITGAPVYRSRVLAITRAESPAVVIEPVDDSADASMVGVLTWSLLLRIAVITRGEIPDSLADPIIKQIHDKLMLDRGLGGLSMDIVAESAKFELQEGDQSVGIFSLGYRIAYRTNANDLSALI